MAKFTSNAIAAEVCGMTGGSGHHIVTHQTGVEIGPNGTILQKFESYCDRCGLSLTKIRGRVRVGNKKGHPDVDSE